MDYKTFLSITLTALGVILAALGAIVAIVAIWGYQSIKKEASTAATNAVEKAVRNAIEEKFGLESLEETIKNIIEERLGPDLDIAYAQVEEKLSKGSVKGGPVADKYPGSDEGDNSEKP